MPKHATITYYEFTKRCTSEKARKNIPDAIQQAYSIVVTVSDKNEVQAFKITVESGKPLFEQIKADNRSRIQDTPISAEALLPDGPYNLWRAGKHRAVSRISSERSR